MIKARNLFWLLPLVILLTFPFWRPIAADFLEPGGELRPTTAAVQPSRFFIMEDVVLTQYNSSRREWNITAQTLYGAKGEGDLQMEILAAVFFDNKATDPNTQPATYISGKNALYEKSMQTLTVTDDVTVLTDDGHEMHTDSLRYLEKKRQIKASSGVLITGNNFTVKGQGLTYDQDTGNFQVDGRVYAETW